MGDSNYSMGWNIAHSTKGYTVIHSSGDLNTYHCHILMIPEKGYSVVFMANQNNYIYSTEIYPSFIKALVDYLVAGDTSPENMPKMNMYLQIVGLIILIMIIEQVISIIKISKGNFKLKEWKSNKIIISILVDIIMPVLLLVVIPELISFCIDRAFDLREAFDMLPDITLSFIIISILFLTKADVKTKCIVFSKYKSQ